MSDGVVFLPSFHEAIKDFPDPERLQMYDAIICYGLYGKVPELNPVLRSLFALVKPVVDASQDRYRASKANGSRPPRPGSKPRGRPSKNQTKNQTENQTENQDRDIDSEYDKDSEKKINSDEPHRSSSKNKYGIYGWVKLTNEQHAGLLHDLGATELTRCIQYVDEAAQQTGNKNRWKDWNLVLRRCSREQWGVRPQSDKERESNWREGIVKAYGMGTHNSGASM
jgi:hypothetical protein